MSAICMAWMRSGVVILFGAATLQAATNTWTGGAGGGGTSWNIASDWDSSHVPANIDEAAFGPVATQNKTVTLDAPQSILQLRISGVPTNLTIGSAADVSTGNTLTLGTVQRDATAQTQTIAAVVMAAPNRGSTTWNVANAAGILVDSGTISAKGAVFEKTGAGTLILNGNNTLGDVVGSAGTLTLNGNNTLSNLTANGATIYLTGANALSSVSVLGGTLVLSNANALGSSGTIRFGGGVLRLFDTTDLSGRFSQDSNQAYSVETPTNVTVFATPLTSSGGSLTKRGSGTLRLSAANSYTGPTTLNAGVLSLSGAGTLGCSTSPLTLASGTLDLGGTVQTVGGVTVTGSTTITNGTLNASSYVMGNATPNFFCILGGSGAAVTKSSGGALNLYFANTYTGDTTIMGGSTLQLNFTSSGSPVNDILNSASTLKLAGGTVNVNGKNAAGSKNSQTVNGLSVNAPGASSLTIANGISSGSTLLNLGAMTRQPGATVNFAQPTLNTAVGPTNGYTTTTLNDASGILGGYATVGNTDWAANSGVNIVAYTGYTTLTGNGPTIADNSAGNVRISNASTGTISLAAAGTTTINTLLDKDTAARTNLIGAGNTLRLGAAGGILLPSGTGALTIDLPGSAGTLTAGGADNTPGDLVINNVGSATTITNNAAIADNGTGAVSLTKSGNGALVLTKACTHTGGTWVNAGALYLPGVANALATNSPITMLSAGPLDLGGGTLTNRVGVVLHNSASVLTNGTLAIFGTNLDVWGGTITASLAGSGGILKTTTSPLLITNPVSTSVNTLIGDLVVKEGTVNLGLEFAMSGITNVIVGSPEGGNAASLIKGPAAGNWTPYKAGKSYTIYPNGYVDFTGTAGGGYLNRALTIIGGSLNYWGYMTIQAGTTVKMTGGTFTGYVQNNPPSVDYDITTYATTNAATISSAQAYSLRTVTVARGSSPIDVVFSGSTTFRLIKAGPGVMSITAGLTNAYVGVAGGTLLVNNTMSFNTSGTGQGPVTNAVGATLGGLGTIGGVAGYSNANVVLASAASSATVSTLAPGTIDPITGNHIIGTLTVGSAAQTNSVTFGTYGRLSVTLGSAPPQCDCLAVNGKLNLGAASNGAILDVAAGSSTPRAGDYTVATFNVLTGRFQTVRSVAGALPSRCPVKYLGTSSGRGDELLNGSIVVSVPPMGSVITVW